MASSQNQFEGTDFEVSHADCANYWTALPNANFLDISEGYMNKHENCFEFLLIEHIKQDRPGKVFRNV